MSRPVLSSPQSPVGVGGELHDGAFFAELPNLLQLSMSRRQRPKEKARGDQVCKKKSLLAWWGSPGVRFGSRHNAEDPSIFYATAHSPVGFVHVHGGAGALQTSRRSQSGEIRVDDGDVLAGERRPCSQDAHADALDRSLSAAGAPIMRIRAMRRVPYNASIRGHPDWLLDLRDGNRSDRRLTSTTTDVRMPRAHSGTESRPKRSGSPDDLFPAENPIGGNS